MAVTPGSHEDKLTPFDGTDINITCETFIQQIRCAARNKGKSGDPALMVELLALNLSSAALVWYETLDGSIQNDWEFLRKAVIQRCRSSSIPDVPKVLEGEPNEKSRFGLVRRIKIKNWTAPILRSAVNLPSSEMKWKHQAEERKSKLVGMDGAVYWHLVEDGEPIPSNAIPTGVERGQRLFSIRTWKDGCLAVGKQTPGSLFLRHIRAWIPWWGFETAWSGPFEILVGDPGAVKWVSPLEAGHFEAVKGGFEKHRQEVLLIAQFHHLGALIPGKVFSSNGEGHFGSAFEFHSHNFRVLAWV